MKKSIKYLIFFITAITANHCYAQAAEKKWSIQQCVEYATVHNIQISTLRLNEQSSLQDIVAAKGLKIPNLAANVGNSFYNNSNVGGSGTNQFTTGGNYSLNSSIVLWNDNFINNNIRQKDLLSQSVGLSVQQSQNNITLLITQVYLNILLTKENEKYVNDLVTTSEASTQQGQMFYAAGKIAQKDLLQLQAQLASDRYLLVQTQNAIRQNILILKQLLQLPTDTVFDIVVPPSIEPEAVLASLPNVQQAALQNFPEIKIGQLGVDVAAINIAKTKAGFKPILTASGGMGTGYNSVIANTQIKNKDYFTQTGNNFYQNIGVNLSIPIFSNWANKTNLEKSNIAYKQANLNLDNNRLVLTQAVEQAYLSALNAQQAYKAANQQLLSATESYRIVKEEAQLGVINSYDLLQQRNQYIQAVQAFTNAKYTAVLQEKIYKFYMGNPIIL